MAQKDNPREKRVSKDTPGIAQFRESVDEGKKRREANEQKKLLKEQGVGSTIPASRKRKIQPEQPDDDESPDEDFDATLAEIRAEEARKLKKMDESELQQLWDAGEATGTRPKTSSSVASRPGSSKVQAIGSAQRIHTSTVKGSSTKRKRASSPARSTPKPRDTQSESDSDKRPSHNRGKATEAKRRSMDDADNSGADAGSDEGDSDLETEDGDGDGNGSGDKSTKRGRGKTTRGKTSDFTGIVKKMIDYTTIRVCAKLASSGMFIPPREYKALVAKSWARAAAEYGVDPGKEKYTLKKPHKQSIRARVNSFKSRVRDRLKTAVVSVYKLVSENRTPDEAKEYVQSLIPHGYHTKVGARPGTGHFQHTFLEEAIFESYFTGHNPVGITYTKWFDPMPLEAIAFVCTVIRWVIQQHETGKYVKGKMSFEKLREFYDEVMASLRAFQTGKQAQRCVIVQSTLYIQSMEKAGRSVLEDQPKPAETALQEDDFAEDNPTAEELKLLARGASRGQKTPQNVQKRSERLGRSSVDRSNIRQTQTQTTSQHSSPPPPFPPSSPSSPKQPKQQNGGIETRERHSSVSLDHEESEDEPETTPTPATRKRTTTDNMEAEKDGEDGEDEEDGEINSSASEDGKDDESEEEVTESQPPPQKKQKNEAGSTLLKKLTGSSQKDQKLTPNEARLQGKLKILEGKTGGKPRKPNTKR
ncbi:hypothetical protein RSOLAG22IIIB_11631 [Rhizoctonia solani]|uniref:DUF6532 domain-containing protein n=1 Tax=Rhizoctonia solani TaxID=456999 RepID=A0A0K6GA06_9AGAM|nr:hypothetical protein RSOLAG22IIIB_11631 [Rhizoctonia solani]